MTSVTVTFTFCYQDQREISNGTIYEIRHEVALLLEDCGFGDIEQLPDDKFGNHFAIPTTDGYSPDLHDLYIVYNWELPANEGDFTELVTTVIPRLHTLMRDRFNIVTITRIMYT